MGSSWKNLGRLGPFVVTLLAAGCGGGTAGPPDAAPPDASVAPPDFAIPYPAPHADTPQAASQGGPIAANPKFVAISFPMDPLVASIDDFVAKLAASTYWTGTTAEYGVGKATALPPVHASNAPAAVITDAQIQQWLGAQIKSTPNFPQPDGDTIYALFYQANVTVSFGGKSCQAFNGYHNDFELSPGTFVTYIVLGRCPPPVMSVTVLDNLTATASHEFIEAATDPLPQDDPAWTNVDDDHVAWAALGGGGEIGDLCAAFPDSFYRPADLPYLVQRVWSNAAAAAGHDPCEPDGAHPNFNSAPVLQDITASVTGVGTVATKGLLIPIGQSVTVELDLFSDAPTGGPWTVSAVDLASAFFGRPPELDFSFDKTEGSNGDKIKMTVSALSANPSGTSIYWIQSDLGMTTTVWLGLVVNN